MAEQVVSGLEHAFGRGQKVAHNAGQAAARAGEKIIAAGEKLASLDPTKPDKRPVTILDVIEDGQPAFIVSRGGDRASCNTRTFAEELKRLLERSGQ